MVHNAILVNPTNNLVIYGKSTIFDESDEMNFVYEATNECIALGKRADVAGGIIFLDNAPTLGSAKAIISSQLSKVVYKLPVENESEAAGCQLLEQYGIPAIFNPEIIVTEEHAEIEAKE